MIRRTALSRTLAMSVLSAAIVLLVGWAVTAYTVDTGLDQLPREFSGIGQEAYREACNSGISANQLRSKKYQATLRAIRSRTFSSTKSLRQGSRARPFARTNRVTPREM